MDTPSSSVDAVRSAVSSVATCSPAVSSLLKSLLLPKDDASAADDSNRSSTKTATSSRSRANTLSRAPSKRAKPATTAPTAGNGLSTRERAALATHVVNATLKALGEAAKPVPAAAPPAKDPVQDDDLAKAAARNALRRSSSVPMSPLQPRSLNRQSTSPATTKHTRSPSKPLSNTNLLSAVECARVGLAALRQLPASGKVSLPEMQLESGMSALVARLISLGLHEQAIKELRILKKRLDSTPGPGGEKSAKTPNAEPKNVAQVFAEILDWTDVEASGTRLLLVITTQIQALRLLAMMKKPSAVEAVVPHIRADRASSPINLLLAASEEEGADVGKIARQMETLAQCLMSLAPSVASKDDPLAQESRLSVSPEIALELQALALDARLRWWSMAKHKGDVEKEIMVPLSRCLGAYIRRSSGHSKSSYSTCLNVFNRTYYQLQSQGLKPARGSKLPFASICQTLVTLARDCQQVADAVMWATKLRGAVDEKSESVAKTCSLAAQLLSLQLKNPAKYLSDDQLLQEVVAGIQGPLRGDTTELDELLVNVCALRKAAVQCLLVSAKGNSAETTAFQPSPKTKELLETFILQCPRFCLRWLGKPPGPKGSTKDYLRYEQRRQLLLQYLPHVLDSALMTIKTCLDQSRLTWDFMDSILSDCTALLEYTGNTATSNASASYHVKISHFYYLQYSSLRQKSTDPKDVAPLRALRRSVECVKDRSSPEKDKAQLNLKLERLADLCRTLGRGEEALGALQAIRTSLLDDGVLASVAGALAAESPTVAWARVEKADDLSRTLLAISKMEPVWVDWTVDLPEEERAAALEHRLRFILLREGAREADVTLDHPVVDALLRTYIPPRYPIRRLRVLLMLLCSALGNLGRAPELLSVAKDAAQLEGDGNLGEDSGLAAFLPHMKALYTSLAAAVDAYRDSQALEQAFSGWRSIVASCNDKTDLEKAIDDLPGLLEYLQSVADFLRMKGRDTMLATALELMADITRVAEGPKTDDLVHHSSCLALQYTNLGQAAKAEQMFSKAQEYVAAQVCGETLARFHLAFTDHFVALGNFRQAEEHLSLAQLAFHSAEPAAQKHSRAEKRRLAAYAYYLHSVVALERGDSHHALVYSRESVRSLFQDWVKLESRFGKASLEQSAKPGDGDSADMSAVEIRDDGERQNPGPEFWRLFYCLYRNISWLSSVYAHLGMFQETMYYAEQGLKMARTVDSEFYNAQCAAWIGSVSWKAANAAKAAEMLQQAATLLPDSDRSYCSALLACQISSIYLSQNNLEAADLLLARAEAIAEALAAVPAVTEQPEDKAVAETKGAKAAGGRPARGARKTAARQTAAKKTGNSSAKTKPAAAESPAPVVAIEDAQLAKLRATILVHKATSMLRRKEWTAAQTTLTEATVASKSSSLLSAKQVAMASCLFGMSMEQMAQDPVFSVIQDSTISFPALSGADKNASARSPVKASSPKKSSRSAATASNREATKDPAPRLYVENLREAHDYLLEARSVAALSGDTSLIHRISGMLQNVGLFLAATSPKAKATTHPVQTSYSVELARNLAWRRERKALMQEKNGLRNNDGTLWPPVLSSASTRRSSLGFTLDLHKIQRDYIDIVPKSWNVISMSLSEGNHDLCITKLQAGQSPFVIRLPLERASSRDADTDVFDFQQGRSELLDIIKQINKTCHDSRDMSVKGAKSAWWAEREALDARLKELLQNIEQIWLGGFRGIFSQHVRRADLLERFQKDFLTILDKHLPSRRQVRGKKAKTAAQGPKAVLDLNVLELFIGLGDATRQDCDFDEELTDLLYFVVDILQFHGERNAYDEIDFDSMVVETMDALHAYHSAVKTAGEPDHNVHTILLLDKALHVFPWESLPCMQGLAVSRMPSLACLRRLILDSRQSSPSNDAAATAADNDDTANGHGEGHHVSLARGTYILNPSGDLVSTQSTFAQPLATHLPPKSPTTTSPDSSSWTRIVGRAPTESEFETALTTSDLLLYFGHGSGAQYIRGRTLRRLEPRCRAAVLLMGCSSAALADAGEFEPAGPVWNYMLAGCPAVVGTLWDVTDRDIDRFASGVVEGWGVLPRGSVAVQKVRQAGAAETNWRGGGGGGGGRRRRREGGGGKMSLVEAVAEARGMCRFRYVTAAAVVVYGIPVYVEGR